MSDFIYIASTNIECVKFDEANNTTYVKFLSGSTYAYYNTPPELFDRLIAAESVGSFFAHNYKYKFNYEKIE
jgi:hypothetical protein